MTKPRSVAATANDNSIPGSKLEDGSIGSSKLNLDLNSISGEVIEDGSISVSKLEGGIIADANSITFTQEFSDVQNTVQNKLEQYVSVLDFIPDGVDPAVDDCRVYIQAALDASYAVYFPSGVYTIGGSGLVVNKNGQRLFGDSPANPGGSTLRYIGTGTCLSATAAENSLTYGRLILDNLRFTASGAAASVARAIYIRYIHNCTWTNIAVTEFYEGVFASVCYMNQILGFFADGRIRETVNNLIPVALRGAGSSHWIVSSGNAQITVDLTGFDNTVIQDFDFEPTTGPILLGNSNTLLRCRFERLTLNWKDLSPLEPWIKVGRQSRISGCLFAYNAGPGGVTPAPFEPGPWQPLVRFDGDNSIVDMGEQIFDSRRIVEFSPESEGNEVVIRFPARGTLTDSVNYRSFNNQITNYSNHENHVRWRWNSQEVIEIYRPDGQFCVGQGYFKNLLTGTEDLVNTTKWTTTSTSIILPSTFPVGYEDSAYYAKLVAPSTGGNREGKFIWQDYEINTEDNIYYTLSFAYKTTGRMYVQIYIIRDGVFQLWTEMGSYNTGGRWEKFNNTTWYEENDIISRIVIAYEASTNPSAEALELGEITLNEGYTKPFIPTGAQPVGKRFL